MELRALGPLEVVDDAGRAVDLGGARARTLVAVLLAAAGRLVTVDQLIDRVWGEEAPASAKGSLHSYVSRVRARIEPDRRSRGDAEVLVSEPGGYRLAVDEARIDFCRFERLADDGRRLAAETRWAEARDILRDADALWRGPAFGEHHDAPFALGLAVRLEERRVAAIEDRIAADIALGHHAAVIGELGELVDRYPLREQLQAQRALALYRSGRQAEALRALDAATRLLREELGVDPGRTITELEAMILQHADELTPASSPGPSPAPTPPAVRPAPVDAPAPGLDGRRSPELAPLVGRELEISMVDRALDDALSGPCVLIIDGEPGIGKSRLAEELAAMARERGFVTTWGRAFEGAASPAFWPWLPPLRELADGTDGAARPDGLSVLLDAPDLGGGETTGGRFGLLDSVVELLHDVSARRPVVVILDDVQWADEASLELLATLAVRMSRGRVLLVVTVRQPDGHGNPQVVAALGSLTRLPRTRRLTLRGLDALTSAELLRRVAPVELDVSTSMKVSVRADGNPFFLTELARLCETGATDDLPSGVREVLLRRLDPLSPQTREVLATAAILGRECDLPVVAAASALDPVTCLDAIGPAASQKLLLPVDGRPATFRFAHALVREVIVEQLGPIERARRHLRAADALDGDDPDVTEIVAEHLWAASPIGVSGRAAAALERAGQVAVGRFAYSRAENLLRRAADLYRATSDLDGERRVTSLLVPVIYRGRGNAALVDSALLERAKLIGASDPTALMWSEWAGMDVMCDFDRAYPLARRLLDAARTSDDPTERQMGFTAHAISCWHRGELNEARAHFALAVKELAVTRDVARDRLDIDQLAIPAAFSVYVDDLTGHLDDPEAAYLAAEQQLPGDRYWRLVVATFATSGAAAVGDFDRAVRAARRGIDADPEGLSAFWSMSLRAFLGSSLCILGRPGEGSDLFEQAWREYVGAGVHTNVVVKLANRAIGAVVAGDLEDAERWVEQARAELDTYGEQYGAPLLELAEAELAGARGAAHDEVTRRFAGAFALSAAQGSTAIGRRIRQAAGRHRVTID